MRGRLMLSRGYFRPVVFALVGLFLAQQPVPAQNVESASTVNRPASDSTDSPLFHAKSNPALAEQQRQSQQERIERDNPRLREEWERLRFGGDPTPAFAQRVLSEVQRKSGLHSALLPGSRAPVGVPTWVSIGPTGAVYEQNGPGTLQTADSGRLRTILPHPTDANTLYVLTSGGGLWKTTNFTQPKPTWVVKTDSLATTSGGAVSFGRTPQTLYLGLGDPFDNAFLVGGFMAKSSDGGDTWSSPIALKISNSNGATSVRDVKVDTSGTQDVVLAATDLGMFTSADSGVTFNRAPDTVFQVSQGGLTFSVRVWSIVETTTQGISGPVETWIASIETPQLSSPPSSTDLVGSLVMSTDHGATWQAIPNPANVISKVGRMTLGVGAPGDSIVYAFAANQGDTDQFDLFRSSDGGLSWTLLNMTSKVPTNPTANSDQKNMDLMHGQAFYNQMILVDPRDTGRNTVYLGGNLCSAKTTDGGATWTILAYWLPGLSTGESYPYVHADYHAAAFSSFNNVNTIMFGGDGGFFFSIDDGGTWSNKNSGLVTHLFYSLTSSQLNPDEIFGGTQDNGTRLRSGSSTIYNQPLGGDGFGVGLSQANSAVSIADAEFSHLVHNLTGQPPALNLNWDQGTNGIDRNDSGFFTPVTTPRPAADPTGLVFFTATNHHVYKTADGGASWTAIATSGSNGIAANQTIRVVPHTIGVSPTDLNHIAAAGSAGVLLLTTDGGASWTQHALNSLVSGYVSSTANIAWASDAVLYVCSESSSGSVHVVKSIDGGNTWTRADNGVPDLPVSKLQVDPRDPTGNTVLAATYIGVYRTTDGGANWQPYGAGLPNVRVSDVYMPADGSFVRISTYGRGIWELSGLVFSGATLTDDLLSCDHDGSLDDGETGHLTITLRNEGMTALSNSVATISSSNPNVSFPGGNQIVFPPAAASGTTAGSVAVALNGATGIQQLDFQIAFNDSSLNLPGPVNAVFSTRGNYDMVGSTSDDVESPTTAWTTGSNGALGAQSWQRVAISPYQHRWVDPASDVAADEYLISPVLQVGSGDFSFSYNNRYEFDFDNTVMPTQYFDGSVIELSNDGGAHWTDIGAFANPGYTGPILKTFSNPIEARNAYGGISPSYPDFSKVIVDLGTSYQGQSVQIRFRVGTNAAFGWTGWSLDDFVFNGLINKPFLDLIPDRAMCNTATVLSSLPEPSSYGQQVTFTAAVTKSSGIPTGTVTFKEAAATLGSSLLNPAGTAPFSISSFAVGPHSITAFYGGDASSFASTSNPFSQLVNKADTAVAVSSAGPGNFGQPVSLTASVSSAGGTPTGNSSFFDNGVSIGAQQLNSGQAMVNVTFQSLGSHPITASYGGDTNFNASASPVFPQLINGLNFAINLAHVSQITVADLTPIGGRLKFVTTVQNSDSSVSGIIFTESFTGTNTVTSVEVVPSGTCSQTAPISCSFGTMNNGDLRTVTVVLTPLLTRTIAAQISVNASSTVKTDTAKIRFLPFHH